MSSEEKPGCTKEIQYLYDKIEIIYKHNANYIPEFGDLDGSENLECLNKLHQLALTRVHEENSYRQKKMFEDILPLFDVVESKINEPSTIMVSGFMLMSVQGTIKGHLKILSNLPKRNAVEEQCFLLCQKISVLEPQQAKEFFPLFKEYIMVLSKHYEKITSPLSFEDPSKIANGDNIPFLPGQQCIIV